MTARITTLAVLMILSSPAMAQGVEIGPGGIEVRPPYRTEHVDCHELRAACLHKDELGEQGRGNCERYRHLCRTPQHQYFRQQQGY